MLVRTLCCIALLSLGSAGGALQADQSVRSLLLVQVSFVTGVRDSEARQVFRRLEPGDDIELVREPDNLEDANTIRVEWRGYRIGYIAPEENTALARQLDMGNPLRARILRLSRHRDPDRRIELEIYLPL